MFDRIMSAGKKVVQFVQKHTLAIVGGVAVAASSVPAHAEIVLPTIDFSNISTSIMTYVGPAVDAAIPVAGVLLAVGIGLKIYKRFAK